MTFGNDYERAKSRPMKHFQIELSKTRLHCASTAENKKKKSNGNQSQRIPLAGYSSTVKSWDVYTFFRRVAGYNNNYDAYRAR